MGRRAELTRQRIAACALELFLKRGFDDVTVNEIAAAAGVSHMTVFRHFSTKEDLLLSDPFDPMIAAAVAAQPISLPPFERARRGLRAGWAVLGDTLELDWHNLSRAFSLVSGHAGLRARMWEGNHATAQAIAEVLCEGGASPLEAQAAAGACIGALTAALLAWSENPELPFNDVILSALDTLESKAGGG